MEELADLTRELVATPSHEDPTAAGDKIENWLQEHTDARVHRDEIGNVVARRSNAGSDPAGGDDAGSLALVGHHDVVPPAEDQRDGDCYRVDRRDGRLHGRGSADMKGAVAAAMLAFRDAALTGDETAGEGGPAGDLVLASFVGEEVGGDGARHAIDAGFVPDRAIVGEGSTGYSAPGVTDVAIAHKGRRASTIAAHGERAHASEAEAGTNAIYRACDAVDELRAIEAPSVEIAGDPVGGSVVVTEIEGGTAWNVVPDRCTVTVDERTVPGERVPLERVAEAEGVEWTVDQDLPPMHCDDGTLAEVVLAAAKRAQEDEGSEAVDAAASLGTPQHVVKPHATDAGWLSAAGTDCVVCGPAEPGEAHTDDESVSIAVLHRCRRIYRDAAERLIGASPA